MNEFEWSQLMETARRAAKLRNERVRVRAGLLTDRATRFLGKRWTYTIECPTYCPCRQDQKKESCR